MNAFRVSCFRAKRVAVETLPDLNVFVVGFAEDTDGGGVALVFQRALSNPHEKKDEIADCYSISNELGATHFGGVISYSIHQDKALFSFDAEVSEALGVGSSCEIDINLTDVETARVTEGLLSIIGSRST